MIAIGVTFFGTLLVWQHFKTPPPHLNQSFEKFPISILKPVKGVDEGIRENLLSFFSLDYPSYELIFSVASRNDPAVVLIQDLIDAHPHISSQLILGDVEIGPNPKVNNLILGYERARYDWVLISDSNIRATPDYLKRNVAQLEPGVGMVTSVVSGQNARLLGGQLEATILNTFYLRAMVLSAKLGKPCVLGKSMLFQKSTAARFGGIRSLAPFLAEDYMAGEAMRRLGLRIVLATDPVCQHIGNYTFKSFWLRHLRWGRIRKAQVPLVLLIEPFLGAMVSGICGAYFFGHVFDVSPVLFIFFHLSFWSICDFTLMWKMSQFQTSLKSQPPKLSSFLAVFWFIRELLALPLWVGIVSGSSVNWRGQKLRLQSGGILQKNSEASHL